MTRFIAVLAVLYLVLVAADPEQYAVFGWTVGLFMVLMSPFVARISKGAGGPVFAIGIIMFGIAMLGSSHYQQVRLAAVIAAGAALLLLVSRIAGRRRPATNRQRQQQEQHRHQET